MRASKLITLAAGALLGVLSFGSIEHGGVGVGPALAAQGCGPGYHRDIYGYCRPNYYGGYYGAPYGYYGGAYRRGYGYYGGRYYGRGAYYRGPHVSHYRGGGYRGGRVTHYRGGAYRGGGRAAYRGGGGRRR